MTEASHKWDSHVNFHLGSLHSPVVPCLEKQNADLTSLLHRLEQELTQILAKESSTWSLWVSQALSRIDVPKYSPVRRTLYAQVMSDDKSRERFCRSFCETYPSKVAALLKHDDALFRRFFAQDPMAVRAWFEQFDASGFTRGARALVQHALRNRSITWRRLQWKKGSTGFSPIVGAHQSWRWCDELDVPATVACIIEAEPWFFRTDDWLATLEDGELITVDYPFFAKALSQLLRTMLHDIQMHAWEGPKEPPARPPPEAVMVISEYFDTASWIELARHVLDLPADQLLYLSHKIVEQSFPIEAVPSAVAPSSLSSQYIQGTALSLADLVLLRVQWSDVTQLQLANGLAIHVTELVISIFTGDHSDRRPTFDAIFMEYDQSRTPDSAGNNERQSLQALVHGSLQRGDSCRVVMTYLLQVFIVRYRLQSLGGARAMIEQVFKFNNIEYHAINEEAKSDGVLPIQSMSTRGSRGDRAVDDTLVDPLLSMRAHKGKDKHRRHRHRSRSRGHALDASSTTGNGNDGDDDDDLEQGGKGGGEARRRKRRKHHHHHHHRQGDSGDGGTSEFLGWCIPEMATIESGTPVTPLGFASAVSQWVSHRYALYLHQCYPQLWSSYSKKPS